MEILRSILNMKDTGAMSIRSARALAMMKASGAQKPFSLITAGSLIFRSKLFGFLTPTVPRMHPQDGRVVSNFIVQALRGDPITIYGEGNQTRSFCYVDDLIDGFIRIMNSRSEFTGPVNLGNPVEFRILELAELVLKMTGSSSKLVFKPLPQDDPKQRKPNIALAQKELGWTPKIHLEEGLDKTIHYFKKLPTLLTVS
jgi:nucleoside-diphosphate-sugar epimerase